MQLSLKKKKGITLVLFVLISGAKHRPATIFCGSALEAYGLGKSANTKQWTRGLLSQTVAQASVATMQQGRRHTLDHLPQFRELEVCLSVVSRESILVLQIKQTVSIADARLPHQIKNDPQGSRMYRSIFLHNWNPRSSL